MEVISTIPEAIFIIKKLKPDTPLSISYNYKIKTYSFDNLLTSKEYTEEKMLKLLLQYIMKNSGKKWIYLGNNHLEIYWL